MTEQTPQQGTPTAGTFNPYSVDPSMPNPYATHPTFYSAPTGPPFAAQHQGVDPSKVKQGISIDVEDDDEDLSIQELSSIPVRLVGKEYVTKRAKSIAVVSFARKAEKAEKEEDSLALVDALIDWLYLTFGKEQGTEIEGRLNDPDDALDLTHIMKLLQAVLGRLGANPTM